MKAENTQTAYRDPCGERQQSLAGSLPPWLMKYGRSITMPRMPRVTHHRRKIKSVSICAQINRQNVSGLMVGHGASDISLPECVFLYETSPDKQSNNNECGEENLTTKLGSYVELESFYPLKLTQNSTQNASVKCL